MALSIGVTFTGAEEADVRAYEWKRDKYNEENPEATVDTPQALCEALLLDAVADWRKFEARDNIDTQAKTLWRSASDAQRAAALEALGG